MGKCCVSGCGDMVIKGRSFTLNRPHLQGGRRDHADGTRGLIYKGALKLKPASLEGDFKVFVQWCQEVKRPGRAVRTRTRLRMRTRRASSGARGRRSGAAREHMFFEAGRIDAMLEMILADTKEGREKALKATVWPMQRGDFEGLFAPMRGNPVVYPACWTPRCTSSCRTSALRQEELAEKVGALPVEKVPPAREGTARAEPDGWPARVPPGHHVPGDHTTIAGARHHRGGRGADEAAAVRVQAGDHDSPLVGKKGGAEPSRRKQAVTTAEPKRGCWRRAGCRVPLHDRHDDRGAARLR